MISKQDFLKKMKKKNFFSTHSKVLVAVSTGLDSMNLLFFLHDCQYELGIKIAIAHVNYKKRKESDREEDYLKKLSCKLGVKIFTSNFSGSFSEKDARHFRYSFFKKIMEEKNYTALVTAHHMNDQAETIFMRIVRGSRLQYLSGIRERQIFANGELLRPFLFYKRSSLRPFFHFEDETNRDNFYFRNRIRNDYIPLLSNENPRFIEALLHLGKESNQLFCALNHLTENIDPTDMSIFRQYHPSVQYFLILKYLKKFPDLELSKEQFNELLLILRRDGSYYHSLKSSYVLNKGHHRFSIEKIRPKPDSEEKDIVLESGSVVSYSGYQFSFGRPLKGQGAFYLLVFSNSDIILRHRKMGDRILVHQINKKIRRLFVDRKIPILDRKEAIVVEQEQKILGIVGIAISDLSKNLKNDIMERRLYIQKSK